MTTTPTTPPAAAHLESAKANLRYLRRVSGRDVHVLSQEQAASLMARLDAADKVAAALDVLYDEAERFSVSGVYFAEEWFEHKGLKLADEALAAYRNPAPAAEGE